MYKYFVFGFSLTKQYIHKAIQNCGPEICIKSAKEMYVFVCVCILVSIFTNLNDYVVFKDYCYN